MSYDDYHEQYGCYIVDENSDWIVHRGPIDELLENNDEESTSEESEQLGSSLSLPSLSSLSSPSSPSPSLLSSSSSPSLRSSHSPSSSLSLPDVIIDPSSKLLTVVNSAFSRRSIFVSISGERFNVCTESDRLLIVGSCRVGEEKEKEEKEGEKKEGEKKEEKGENGKDVNKEKKGSDCDMANSEKKNKKKKDKKNNKSITDSNNEKIPHGGDRVLVTNISNDNEKTTRCIVFIVVKIC